MTPWKWKDSRARIDVAAGSQWVSRRFSFRIRRTAWQREYVCALPKGWSDYRRTTEEINWACDPSREGGSCEGPWGYGTLGLVKIIVEAL